MTSQSTSTTNPIPVLHQGVWTGWLARYQQWIEPTTDGAIEAMFAGGSVELALALGRNVAVHYGRRTYANLYVNAVGPTGVTRKTTIESRGLDVRNLAFAEDTVRVSRSIGSGEGLLENFCREEKDPQNSRNTVFNPIPGQRVLLDEPEFTNP